MKIRFIKDATYNDLPFAKEGEVKEIDDNGGHASRWIRRGLAVEVPKEVVAIAKKGKIQKEVEPVAIVEEVTEDEPNGIDVL